MDPLSTEALARLEKLGGPAFVDKMINLFCAFVGEKVAEVSRASAEADFDAVGRAAHAIKSSAANVGAARVCSISVDIDGAVRSGRNAGVIDMAKELQAAFDEVKPLLEARIGPGSQGGDGKGA